MVGPVVVPVADIAQGCESGVDDFPETLGDEQVVHVDLLGFAFPCFDRRCRPLDGADRVCLPRLVVFPLDEGPRLHGEPGQDGHLWQVILVHESEPLALLQGAQSRLYLRAERRVVNLGDEVVQVSHAGQR